MTFFMKTNHEIHLATLLIAETYRNSERELIPMIQLIDERRIYLEHNCPSLYAYLTNVLRLSPGSANALSAVSRKALQVPALQKALLDGDLSVSQGKRILAVLENNETSQAWIERAKVCTQREIEKEVASACPKAAVKEKVAYIQASRLALQCGVSEDLMKKLERVKDLVGSSSLEHALEAMAECYLEKHDPIRKAERASLRKQKTVPLNSSRNEKRTPIPASLKHQVSLRDQGQCQEPGCRKSRWTDIHHIRPVCLGGQNELNNLITLCSGHHRLLHFKQTSLFEEKGSYKPALAS